jgi:hypothetical protein
MRYVSITLLMFFILTTGSLSRLCSAQEPDFQKWELKSLKKIGGHKVQVFGNPEVVKTDIGKAIRFDGIDDRILVDNNPIGTAKEFTIEVIFKADPAYEISNQPRFVHFQDPGDNLEKRVMVELRLTTDNKWYLDGYMQTDAGNKTLVNRTLTHPLGSWDHVALTFKGNTFTTYVNGVKEISGEVPWKDMLINERGKVSMGGRMNEINYFAGLIKTLKVTHKALSPEQFLKTVK